jgi:RNA ligase
MIECVKFQSIGQFRDAIKLIKLRLCKDKQIFTFPTVRFYGTVKAHGTNAAFRQDTPDGDIIFQSRERVIDSTSDNAGFATTFWPHRDTIKELFNQIRSIILTSIVDGQIIIYGEWAGGNIQKSVGLAQTPKMFYPFSIKVTQGEHVSFVSPHHAIFDVIMGNPPITFIKSIAQFGSRVLDVDLNAPELMQNQIVEWVEEVEKGCPIAKSYGVDGVGEGLVFIAGHPYSDVMFKAKGELHSVTKVKTVGSIDVERVNSIKELVSVVCTENRMLQIFNNLNDLGIEVSRAGTGQFIKAVIADCFKEEIDTITANGVTGKDFHAAAQQIIVRFFHKRV